MLLSFTKSHFLHHQLIFVSHARRKATDQRNSCTGK